LPALVWRERIAPRKLRLHHPAVLFSAENVAGGQGQHLFLRTKVNLRVIGFAPGQGKNAIAVDQSAGLNFHNISGGQFAKPGKNFIGRIFYDRKLAGVSEDEDVPLLARESGAGKMHRPSGKSGVKNVKIRAFRKNQLRVNSNPRNDYGGRLKTASGPGKDIKARFVMEIKPSPTSQTSAGMAWDFQKKTKTASAANAHPRKNQNLK